MTNDQDQHGFVVTPGPQSMLAYDAEGAVRHLQLPSPESEVVPGVPWGRFDVTLTPAFWAGRVFLANLDATAANYRLGRSLREEVAACLLGGHGLPAEVGIAAFERLRDEGLLCGQPSAEQIEDRLREPLAIGLRKVRYRFARQRASYVAEALRSVREDDAHQPSRQLRDMLLTLPGVGPKTASWIVRNHLDADDVAIIDVHILRACVAAGVFSPKMTAAKDYFELEDRFLAFARGLACRPSTLDNVMWRETRELRAA